MPYPAITALPTPPARTDDSTTFSNRADALLAALPGFVTEANAAGDWVETEEGIIEGHKTAAEAAQAAAEAAKTAAESLTTLQNYKGPWAAGTTYQIGDSVKHDNYFWYSNVADNLGNTPPGGAQQWELFSLRSGLGLVSTKTDTASIASKTWASTGLEISNMLVSNGANPVLLIASISAYVSSSGLYFRFTRDGGPILTGDAAGSRVPVTSGLENSDGGQYLSHITFMGVDIPGSSGAKNYAIQWRTGQSVFTCYLNRTNSDTDDPDYPRSLSVFRAVEML